MLVKKENLQSLLIQKNPFLVHQGPQDYQAMMEFLVKQVSEEKKVQRE